MPVALWLKRQPNVFRKQTKRRAFFRWPCNHAYAWHRGWDVRRPLHARVRGRLERKGRSLTNREHSLPAIIRRWKRVSVASSSLVGTTTATRTARVLMVAIGRIGWLIVRGEGGVTSGMWSGGYLLLRCISDDIWFQVAGPRLCFILFEKTSIVDITST